MNKKKPALVTRNVKESSHDKSLSKLLAKSNPEDLNVSFIHHDGSSRQLSINPTFVLSEKGRRLNPFEIIKKLNTLKHDFKAKSYKVVNLSL